MIRYLSMIIHLYYIYMCVYILFFCIAYILESIRALVVFNVAPVRRLKSAM